MTDVVLTTKADNVVLSRTHIDVLEGPEKRRVLYMDTEEKRLHLRSFAAQLEDVARRSNDESAHVHMTSGQTPHVLVGCAGKGDINFVHKLRF